MAQVSIRYLDWLQSLERRYFSQMVHPNPQSMALLLGGLHHDCECHHLSHHCHAIHCQYDADKHTGVFAAYDALPFEPNSLELIVLSHTMEWYPDPVAVLKEVDLILKPGGQVLISCLNPLRPMSRRLWRHYLKRHDVDNAQMISQHMLLQLSRALGWQMTHVRRCGFWVPKLNGVSDIKMRYFDMLALNLCPWLGVSFMVSLQKTAIKAVLESEPAIENSVRKKEAVIEGRYKEDKL